MHEGRDHEEAWAAFDAALREVTQPGPDPALRDLCLPSDLSSEFRVPGSGLPMAERRILVADDEPNIRRLIEYHLSLDGYLLSLAADGEEALARVREERPDLIVLDVMMPRLTGLQVLRILKDDPRTAEIPVVLLTARSSDDHIRHGWYVGTDFYMTKPFNPHMLRQVVQRMVAVLGTPENPPPLRRWLK